MQDIVRRLYSIVGLVLLVLLTEYIFLNFNPITSKSLANRLEEAKADFDKLNQEYKSLRTLYASLKIVDGFQLDQDEISQNIQDSKKKIEKNSSLFNKKSPKGIPNLGYELTRRSIANGIKELFYFLNAELNNLRGSPAFKFTTIPSYIQQFLNSAEDHLRYLLFKIDDLSEVDRYSEWRIKEGRELSDLVQRRLKHLQNPKNCTKAKKLFCILNKGCGLECEIYHAVYCLLIAFATKRTLVLNSKYWKYHENWEDVFLPVSEKCTDTTKNTLTLRQVLAFQSNLSITVPKDLAPRLLRLQGDPITWWIGQFVKYILRLQSDPEKMLQETERKFKFKQPIVGIHVIRSEKESSKAPIHAIENYMKIADDYFVNLELRHQVDRRRVYIASNDPRTITYVQIKYPNYEVIGDVSGISLKSRYTEKTFKRTIVDIHFLSESNFLVCPSTSMVCRLAYEIMQTYFPDFTNRFQSLADIYYFNEQLKFTHYEIAIISYKAKCSLEMDLKVGDLVEVVNNYRNGSSKGTNLRTNQTGVYPSHKVRKWVAKKENFRIYPDLYLKNSQLHDFKLH